MDIIDKRGRLFGVINVIDAMAVLLVAVVIVAGVAFVLQPEPEPGPTEPTEPVEPAPETSTVTAVLDLGTQSELLASRIRIGQTFSPAENSNITITDVYVGPHDDAVRVIIVTELEGPISNDTIAYNGEPPRLGRQLTIQTEDYMVSGIIRKVGGGLDHQTTPVLVSQTVDVSTAEAIQDGDTLSRAGRDIATVESIDAFGTDDPNRRLVFLGLSLRTLDLGDGPQLGSTPIHQGATLTLEIADYTVIGTVERVGSTALEGEPATQEVTLQLGNVGPEIANSLRSGLTETVAGQTNARITSVEIRPSPVLITTDNGNVVVGEHPTRKRVTLTAELSVRETDTGLTFKGRRLQLGRTVHLDLGTVTVEATVVEIDE